MHASARSVSSRTLSLPDKNLQPQINLKKKNKKKKKKKTKKKKKKKNLYVAVE